MALCLFVSSPVHAAPTPGDRPLETAQDPSDPKVERARELAKNGGELYRDGSYDAAIVAFEAAYELVSDSNLLYNIFLAHEKAGRLEAAADALDRYRAFAPAGEREQLQARSVALRKRAQSDPQPREIIPDPLDDPSRAPMIEPGLDEEPGEADDPTGGESRDLEDTDKPAPLMGPVGWSLGVLSVAALGSGIGLGVGSISKRDEAKLNCEPETTQPLCLSSAADALDASHRMAFGADIAFAVAGAAAIGTVVWVAVRAKKRGGRDSAGRKSKPELALTPSLSPRFFGGSLSARF